MQLRDGEAVRVMVTGGRDLLDPVRVRAAFELLRLEGPVTLIHGDARGADRLCHDYALSQGWAVERFPALWEADGLAAGPKRNQRMVDTSPRLCVAFPTCPEGTKGSGTWDAIARVRRAGISLLIA